MVAKLKHILFHWSKILVYKLVLRGLPLIGWGSKSDDLIGS